MQSSFWLDRWQRQVIGFHQSDVEPALVEHWPALGLPDASHVLVPMCGKTLDMLWLREQGHAVLGVELSPIAVAAFFDEQDIPASVSQRGAFECWEGDGIRILCGDVFALTAGDVAGIAGVYDRAALVALPYDMRLRYAKHMRAILPVGAAMLLVTVEYDESDREGPPFSVDSSEAARLYGAQNVQQLRHLDHESVYRVALTRTHP